MCVSVFVGFYAYMYLNLSLCHIHSLFIGVTALFFSSKNYNILVKLINCFPSFTFMSFDFENNVITVSISGVSTQNTG